MEIYTDGSCIGNPGPGGYACVVIKNGKVAFSIVESVSNTTNNRMELMAVLTSLFVLRGYKPVDKVKIYSDSSYCIDGSTKWIKSWVKNGWKTADKKDVKNKDLWLQYLEFKDENFELIKVKSHIGIKFNELADSLAYKMASI